MILPKTRNRQNCSAFARGCVDVYAITDMRAWVLPQGMCIL